MYGVNRVNICTHRVKLPNNNLQEAGLTKKKCMYGAVVVYTMTHYTLNALIVSSRGEMKPVNRKMKSEKEKKSAESSASP